MHSVKRNLLILLRTPLIPPPPGPTVLELTTIAGPSRPRASSRAFSNLSMKSTHGYSMEGKRFASNHGQNELYSDEAGSTGAGTDDVAHTDAAFNKDPNPASASKGVEKESGKDFTTRSSANADYSHPPGKKGEPGSGVDLGTSKTEAKENDKK